MGVVSLDLASATGKWEGRWYPRSSYCPRGFSWYQIPLSWALWPGGRCEAISLL